MYIFAILLLSQNNMFEPSKVLQFAEYLYDQKYYSAALNEYRRYLFLTDTTYELVSEKIIDCLIRLEKFDEALKESARLKDEMKSDFTKGLIYFLAGKFDSSRTHLNRAGIPYKENARRLIGLSYAQEFKFQNAAEYIELPKDVPKYKKPVLGALFALCPGGGHFYCGRIGDGIFSFLVISTASLLSYYYYDREEDIKFGIALGATILFYAGNIYGGINAVRNYNYYQNERYLSAIEVKFTHESQ